MRSKNYTEKFWCNQEVVDTFGNLPLAPYWEKFFRTFYKQKQVKILDLGCGSGRYTKMFATLGFNVWACDIYEPMLNATKSKLSRLMSTARLSRRIKYADMGALPFAQEYFDIVFANGVYHNASSISKFLRAVRESSRVLKRDGILCVNLFYVGRKLPRGIIAIDPKRHLYQTREGLLMVLLPRRMLLKIFTQYRLYAVDKIKIYKSGVLTGIRDVLRGIFKKI